MIGPVNTNWLYLGAKNPKLNTIDAEKYEIQGSFQSS